MKIFAFSQKFWYAQLTAMLIEFVCVIYPGGHASVPKQEQHPYQCKYEDGKLFYEGEWYNKGHHIIIDNRQESPVQ